MTKALDMQPRKISDEHRRRLKAAWTDARKRARAAAQLGKKRGKYRKDV